MITHVCDVDDAVNRCAMWFVCSLLAIFDSIANFSIGAWRLLILWMRHGKNDNIVFDPWGDIRYELSSSSSLRGGFRCKGLRDHTVLCTVHCALKKSTTSHCFNRTIEWQNHLSKFATAFVLTVGRVLVSSFWHPFRFAWIDWFRISGFHVRQRAGLIMPTPTVQFTVHCCSVRESILEFAEILLVRISSMAWGHLNRERYKNV